MTQLIDDLNVLHDHYVHAVNEAVAHNDFRRVDTLSRDYDGESFRMVAAHEGVTTLPRRVRA